MGFTEASGRAPCRWVGVRHGLSVGGNDHIHLVVNLFREDGTKARVWNDSRTVGRLCTKLEHRYGLRVVEGRPGAGIPALTRAETEIAQRTGQPEPPWRRLARTVRGCATTAGSEAEFVRRLRSAGLLARPRYGPGGREAVVGYSVALRPAAGETVVWFGGGRLGRDLTLPRLRALGPRRRAGRRRGRRVGRDRSPRHQIRRRVRSRHVGASRGGGGAGAGTADSRAHRRLGHLGRGGPRGRRGARGLVDPARR
jgi:hypothetical protein